jgi:hypothetical protein
MAFKVRRSSLQYACFLFLLPNFIFVSTHSALWGNTLSLLNFSAVTLTTSLPLNIPASALMLLPLAQQQVKLQKPFHMRFMAARIREDQKMLNS